MAVAINLDEATLAKVKEYAAKAFEGFSEKSTIYPTSCSRIDIPAMDAAPVVWNDGADPLWEWESYEHCIIANHLELLKSRHAPRWLRRIWPVRWKEVTSYRPVSTTFGAARIDLELHMSLDNCRTLVYLGYNATYNLLAVKLVQRERGW